MLANATVNFSTQHGKPAKELTDDMTWNARGNQWRLNAAFDPQTVR